MIILLERHRLALLGLSVVIAVSLLGVAAEQDQAKSPAQEAMIKIKEDVGAFEFNGKLNLASIGQPGGEVNFNGVSKSQMVLDGTGILSVAEVNGQQSLNYMGYRSDTKEYFNINLDPNQTALDYVAGNFTKPNVLTMTNPTTQVTVETVGAPNGASTTTVRIPPNQTMMMSIENSRVNATPTNVLKQLMAGPVKPKRINRKADSVYPSENYAPGHVILQKFAGSFATKDGYKAESRMVGEGRYVLTHVTAPAQFLAFTAYNSEGKFFQQMLIGPSVPAPMYMQGPLQKDGSILMSDPFNPNGMKVVITFDENGDYSTSTSMGDQGVLKRTWVLEK